MTAPIDIGMGKKREEKRTREDGKEQGNARVP